MLFLPALLWFFLQSPVPMDRDAHVTFLQATLFFMQSEPVSAQLSSNSSDFDPEALFPLKEQGLLFFAACNPVQSNSLNSSAEINLGLRKALITCHYNIPILFDALKEGVTQFRAGPLNA